MYSVTYQALGKTNRRNYQTESRAIRSIWKWLQCNSGTAILYVPEEEPRVIDDWRELTFEKPVEVDFYQSTKWLQLRIKAFEKYGNRCSCCGASPDTGAILHVDHIKPRSLCPELALVLNNLQILCKQCNVGKSNLSEKKWR